MSAARETVAALLTAPAPGAIAVIGLSGPRTEAILEIILRRVSPPNVAPAKRVAPANPSCVAPTNPPSVAPASSRCNEPSITLPIHNNLPNLVDMRPTLTRIVAGDKTIDDAVVILIRRGADAHAEINTHGGVRIAQRVQMLLAAQGARIVPADEFPITPLDPDSIVRQIDNALVHSASRRLTVWLLHQRELLPPFLRGFARLGHAEQSDYRRRTQTAIRLIRGLSIAIVGPPNAGKSTLANRLIGHDRVITSDRPGTTRDWVSETALISGWPVTLTDTAGIRDTDCTIESESIRRGTELARQADLVLIVLDSTTSAPEQTVAYRRIIDRLPNETLRLAVFNKCDLAASNLAAMKDVPCCRVSALRAKGIAELERQIEAMLSLDQIRDDQPTGILPVHLEI